MENSYLAQVQLEQVAVLPLGNAWSGNSLNCVTYRQGLFTRNGRQAVSFVDAEGSLVVVRRDLQQGSIETVRLPTQLTSRDAHFSSSLVIDAQDRIHVAGGAHVSEALYARATDSDLSSLRWVIDPAIVSEERTSYPSFLTDQHGNLHFLYRRGHPARSVLRTRQWIASESSWSSEPFTLINGYGSQLLRLGPYINTPLREHKGRFGFFYVWRSSSLPNSKPHIRNIGIDFCEVDLAEQRAFTHSGLELQVPVTPYVSERVVAVSWDANLSNQAGATRLPDGRPFGVTMLAQPGQPSQIHIFWPDLTGRWHCYPITNFTSNRTMSGNGTLYLPHSRPSCAALPDSSVLVVFRTREAGNRLLARRMMPPHYHAHEAENYVLWADDLGFYEPVLDVELMERTGRICAYVQHCGDMPDGEAAFGRVSAPAYLVEWKLPI